MMNKAPIPIAFIVLISILAVPVNALADFYAEGASNNMRAGINTEKYCNYAGGNRIRCKLEFGKKAWFFYEVGQAREKGMCQWEVENVGSIYQGGDKWTVRPLQEKYMKCKATWKGPNTVEIADLTPVPVDLTPQGPYKETCKNILVLNGVLHATCVAVRTIGGRTGKVWVAVTPLKLPCHGKVENQDGKLVCV